MKQKFLSQILPCMVIFGLCGCSSSDSDGNIVGPDRKSSAAEEPIESSSSAKEVTPVDYSKGAAMNKKLGNGINFGNTFDATCETCWGAGPVKPEQVALMAKLGFKTARLPVRWDEAASKEAPYTIKPEYIARIKEVLGYFKDNNMRVMMNMHHHASFLNDMVNGMPNEANAEYNLTRVDSIWAQISREFKDYDNDFLLFELFNEPVNGVSSDLYNTMIQRTYPIIRKHNPGRTLVYNTYPWGGYAGIKKLVLPENDGNVIIDVHYYEPQLLTHQGHNTKCDVNNPVKWLGSRAEKSKISTDFDNMRAYADARFPATNPEGIPITIGEFGVSTCNNLDSKAKWIEFVVETMDSHDMSWQYWAFTSVGGFEFYNKKYNTWETSTLEALGIDPSLVEGQFPPSSASISSSSSTESSSSIDTSSSEATSSSSEE